MFILDFALIHELQTEAGKIILTLYNSVIFLTGPRDGRGSFFFTGRGGAEHGGAGKGS